MDRKVKIILGAIGVALLIKIVAQRGGFSGLTIGNKSQKLQDLFKGLNEKNLKAKTSGIADKVAFVEFDFATPFGIQNSKFYDNGTYVFTKKYNSETYKGNWKESGEIVIDGLGSYNEGNLTTTALAINTMLM